MSRSILRKLHFPRRKSSVYQALVKAGISLIAKVGRAKARSVAGHHIKILTKMSEILGREDIFTLANAMRMRRNLDLYSGGEYISETEANEYFQFAEQTVMDVKKVLERKKKDGKQRNQRKKGKN